MPKWWSNFMTRLTAATKAFQKPDVTTDPPDLDADWNSWESRRLRYAIFWAFYENTTYDEMSFRNWPQQYKTRYGLYRYIRNIYNPSWRLGEFWKAHLWAGTLEDIPLIFPETVAEEDLLGAIKQIWQWSNWQVKKDIVPLYGSVLGDVGILIIDDPQREKVFFEVINPNNIANIELDPVGNVKGYEIQEERQDPRTNKEKSVVYSEIAVRDGEDVIYTTLLDGAPWPWNVDENGEGVASWSRPYGFIPLTLIQHNDVGLQWGWSEIQPGQSKFREIDDQSSKLNDQIRKVTDPIWAFFGITKPEDDPTFTETRLTGTAAANRPQPGREQMNALYGNSDGSAVPLVAPLDIEAVIGNIEALTKEIERDYPELRLMALDEAGGNISGRALRLAQQPAETKVNQRRPNYYSALVRANQMAIAIAGFNGYNGFESFDLDSFDRGLLEHSIGKMPIFGIDPLDELELEKERAAVAKIWTDAGAGIEQAAIQAGLTEDEAAALAQIDLGILER
jgi:hypothetical protein